MADFKKALFLTMGNEGGYNHGVGENETFFGIDRGMNPNWTGWAIVDSIKAENPGLSDGHLNPIFKANPTLIANKDTFYKRNYWDILSLDVINDQQVAEDLFDCSVNPCIDTAAKVFQKGCNVIKPGALVVDGAIGSVTISVANACAPDLLVTAINGIRSANYHHRVELTPSDAQWLHSWLNRLIPYHK